MSSDMRTTILQYKSFMETFKDKTDMVLGVLKELDKLDTISYKLLKETGIGKTVNNFRKVEGPVGVLAKKLVSLWKDLASTAIKSTENKQISQLPVGKIGSTVADSSEINAKLSERYPPRTDVVVKQENLDTDFEKQPTTEVRDHCASTSVIETVIKKEIDDANVNATDLKSDVKVERSVTTDLKVKMKGDYVSTSADSHEESAKKISKDKVKVKTLSNSVTDAAKNIKQEKKSKSKKKDVEKKREMEPSFEDALLAQPKSRKNMKTKHLTSKMENKYEHETETSSSDKLSPKHTEVKIVSQDDDNFHDGEEDLASLHSAVSLSKTSCELVPVKKEKLNKSRHSGVMVKVEKYGNTESHLSKEQDMKDLKIPENSSELCDGSKDLAFLHGSVSLCKTDCDLASPKQQNGTGGGMSPDKKTVLPSSGKKTLALSDYKQLQNVKKEKLPNVYDDIAALDQSKRKTCSGVETKDDKDDLPPSLDKLQFDLNHLMNIVQCKQPISTPSSEFSAGKDNSPKGSAVLPKAYVQNSNSSPEMLNSTHRDSVKSSPGHSSSGYKSKDSAHQAGYSSSSCPKNELDQQPLFEKRSSHKGDSKRRGKHKESDRKSDKHSLKLHRSRRSDLSDFDQGGRYSKEIYSVDSAHDDSPAPKSSRYSEEDDSQNRKDYRPSALTDEKKCHKNTGSQNSRQNSETENSKKFLEDFANVSSKDCRKSVEHRSSKDSRKDSGHRSSKDSREGSRRGRSKDSRECSERRSSKDSHEESKHRALKDSRRYSEHKSKDSSRLSEHENFEDAQPDSEHKSFKSSKQDFKHKSRKTVHHRRDVESSRPDDYERKSKKSHKDRSSSSSKSAKKFHRPHSSPDPCRQSELSEKCELVHSSSKDKHKHASEKHRPHKRCKQDSAFEDDMSSREGLHKSAKKHKPSTDNPHKRKRKISDGGMDASSGQTFEQLLSTKSADAPKKRRSPTFEQKIAKSVAEKPLPQSYLDDLPELVTDYKPLPRAGDALTNRHERAEGNSKLEFSDIKASSRAESVYSGRRRGYSSMHSLMDLCLHVLGNNIDDIGYVGGVPFSILEPVLKKATARQLLSIEEYNADFTEESDNLWRDHCARDFKNHKPAEFESWRELYLRKVEEREKKLEMLQSKISAKEQQKSSEARKSKVAYAMASAPKPPREVRRQQAKYGTGSGSMESTARAAAIQKHEQSIRPFVCSRSGGGASRDSKATVKVISVPPLMKKARKFMNRLHR